MSTPTAARGVVANSSYYSEGIYSDSSRVMKSVTGEGHTDVTLGVPLSLHHNVSLPSPSSIQSLTNPEEGGPGSGHLDVQGSVSESRGL